MYLEDMRLEEAGPGVQGVSGWKPRPQPTPSAPTNVEGRQRLL